MDTCIVSGYMYEGCGVLHVFVGGVIKTCYEVGVEYMYEVGWSTCMM